MAYDVFLSSKSEDYSFAQQVCEYLTQNEYRVFFSQRVLQEKGAADFRAQIDRAIEASQHLVAVTSRGQHVKGGWVEAEWGALLNEKRSGRKEGNVVTVTFGNVAIEELPLALRQFEVLPWTAEGKRNLLSFVAPVVQEIFRIDLRANRIYWGRRPTQHRDLIALPEDQRVDGDKRGNVIRVWRSSLDATRPGLCQLAVRLILENPEAARTARVRLSHITIEDNNGVVLYPEP